jgi:hypothetical protein
MIEATYRQHTTVHGAKILLFDELYVLIVAASYLDAHLLTVRGQVADIPNLECLEFYFRMTSHGNAPLMNISL